MNSLTAFARHLAEYQGPGLLGSDGVWQIQGNTSSIEQFKRQLLETICVDSAPFVHYEEGPPNRSSLRGTKSVSMGIWQVPSGATGADLMEWLYMGNWQLYLSTEPLDRIPDLCRSTAAQVRVFVQSTGIGLVIDSFHDDVSWTIGLASLRDDA
jgi:hypothetical protein